MGLPEGDDTNGRDLGSAPPANDPHAGETGPGDLRAAIRRARVEAAERTDVLAELRGAEVARLEMLQDALRPVLAALPPAADLFDMGIVAGSHPRLFVDMIAFVDMGRDRRLYRFHQDTRVGRVVLAESEQSDKIVAAVTSYIGRRLVERDQALAALPRAAVASEGPAPAFTAPSPQSPPRSFRLLRATFVFLIDLLGTAALVFLLLAGLWYAGTSLLAWSNGR